MSDRKEIVRQFYERQIEAEAYLIDGTSYLMPDAKIGRVELVTTGDWGDYGFDGDFDTVEIERIEQAVPQSVIEAFDRHTWFSQYSLSHVFAFKISVEEHDTYAIGIDGIAGDAWDNFGRFIEVFDESGELLGAAKVYDGEIVWLDRYIDGDDFNVHAPKWTGNPDPVKDREKMWSEEVSVSVEQDGGVTRMVMILPN